MTARNARTAALFSTAALSAVAFVLLSFDVLARPGRKKTSRVDREERSKWLAVSTPSVARFATITGHVGKWYAHVPLALALAAWVPKKKDPAAALAVVGASVGSAVMSRVIERILPHREPPPGRRDPSQQSYPSGHTLEPLALAVAASYVALREGHARWIPAPLFGGALIASLGRLALDRHWSSDVTAGACAGLAIGTACAGAYELAR
jgi:membrane-associated phospholipid phosphatase